MRIVTLGHSGVGKTTYMASLYGQLQHSFKGFTLHTGSKVVHTELTQLAAAIKKNEYPPMTAYRDEYKFILRFDGTDIIKFKWTDYRGGTLRDITENEQAQLLHKDLKKADGLMMLVDSETLKQQTIKRSEIGRMVALLNQAVGSLQNPISLAIVFTKSDLVSQYEQSMLEHLYGLLASLETSSHIKGALIPVACGQQSRNIPLPLFFALHSAICFQADRLYEEIKAHKTKAKNLEKRSEGLEGFFNVLVSAWNGTPSNGELALQQHRQAIDKSVQHKEITSTVQAIGTEIERLALVQRNQDGTEYIRRLNQMK